MYSVSNAPRMQLTDVAEIPLQASYAKPVVWLPSARLDCSKRKPVVIRQGIERLQSSFARDGKTGGCSVSISPIAGFAADTHAPTGSYIFCTQGQYRKAVQCEDISLERQQQWRNVWI